MQGPVVAATKQEQARTFWQQFKEEEEAFAAELGMSTNNVEAAAAKASKKRKQDSEAGTSASAGAVEAIAKETVPKKTAQPAPPDKEFVNLAYSGSWPTTTSNTVRGARASGALDIHLRVMKFMDKPADWFSANVVLPADFPEQLVTEEADAKLWKALPDMEIEVLKLQELHPARERRLLFVRHQGDQPPHQQEYNSLLDVKMHHIAIGRVERECSKYGRGWDILRIDSDVLEMPGRRPSVKATYLTLSKGAEDAQSWPDNWPNYLFVPLGLPPPPPVPGQKKTGKKPAFVEHQEEFFPVDCIEWSTEQKVTNGSRVLRIPVSVQKFALRVAQAIESGDEPHAEMPQIGEGEDGDD